VSHPGLHVQRVVSADSEDESQIIVVDRLARSRAEPLEADLLVVALAGAVANSLDVGL
jgi:hypothetical protein